MLKYVWIFFNILLENIKEYTEIPEKKELVFKIMCVDKDKDISITWKIKSILKLTGCICENDKLIFITIYYIINFRDDKKTLLLNTYEKLMKKSTL